MQAVAGEPSCRGRREHHVQDDLVKRRIGSVPVLFPCLGAGVYLDVAPHALPAELYFGVGEIRPGTPVPAAGIQNPHKTMTLCGTVTLEESGEPPALHLQFRRKLRGNACRCTTGIYLSQQLPVLLDQVWA